MCTKFLGYIPCTKWQVYALCVMCQQDYDCDVCTKCQGYIMPTLNGPPANFSALPRNSFSFRSPSSSSSLGHSQSSVDHGVLIHFGWLHLGVPSTSRVTPPALRSENAPIEKMRMKHHTHTHFNIDNRYLKAVKCFLIST